jgi:nucleotide-binding universal stress UspA family protein
MARERWIVVGTDFSEGAEDALERAIRMAEDSGARIALVHAYEEHPEAPAAADPTADLQEQLARQIAASGAGRRGIQVEPLLRRGAPWDKILNVATEYGADMVVVGCCGQRGTIRAPLLGSVANRVLALSTRCVVVARPRLVPPEA